MGQSSVQQSISLLVVKETSWVVKASIKPIFEEVNQGFTTGLIMAGSRPWTADLL